MSSCQSPASPRKREVIAWERSCRQNYAWHIDRFEIVDISQNEFSGFAEMILIHLPLIFIYVVGEMNAPASALQTDSH